MIEILWIFMKRYAIASQSNKNHRSLSGVSETVCRFLTH